MAIDLAESSAGKHLIVDKTNSGGRIENYILMPFDSIEEACKVCEDAFRMSQEDHEILNLELWSNGRRRQVWTNKPNSRRSI